MILNSIPKIKHLQSGQFFLMAGPCAIEGEEMAMRIASRLVTLCNKFKIPLIFKGSFKKANRSRIDSFTGIGDLEALKILAKVRDSYDVPIITDIHEISHAAMAADYVDVLQIPSFLCRQTDLVVAAAKTGKVVNLKKGQFMAPEAMSFAVNKVKDSGNDRVIITERGTTFGYQDLQVDFRGIPIMQQYASTVLDVTHSLQKPNQTSGVTSGVPALVETIARAGIAVGVDGIFIETHHDPSNAKSDGANMLPLERLESLLEKLVAIRGAVNNFS